MHIGRQTGRQYRVLAVLSGSSKDMYNHDVGKRFYEVKRHSDERHPLFYFISFIGIYSPLTDIVIVHIVYINESNLYTPLVTIFHIQICYQLLQTHPSAHSLLRRRRRRISLNVGSECDHLPEAGNNNYLGSECDHLPEAGNIYWYPLIPITMSVRGEYMPMRRMK
jgi:hypothetical protein